MQEKSADNLDWSGSQDRDDLASSTAREILADREYLLEQLERLDGTVSDRWTFPNLFIFPGERIAA